MPEPIMDKVNALIARYAEELAGNGIVCTASKRYFERRVFPSSVHTKFSFIDHWIYGRLERKYKNQHNRYHSVVLRFAPVGKAHKKPRDCKEYAFLLRKVERAHEGLAPEGKVCREDRVLTKIEKRIQKTLQRAAGRPAEQACRDTLWDALRYTYSGKYGYKQTVFGRDRSSFDLIFSGIFAGIMLLVCFILWCISKF